MSKINHKQSKLKIKKLVERYEKLSDAEIRNYNEQQTKDHFIQPLFEALGWDFTKDVWSETNVQGKRVDYAFMLGGLTKFFVEAKSLKVDLDIETHARQAINYSWNKGVTWAVLTDFEGVKIFNAQAQSKLLIDKLIFEIPYSEYISDFDRLWLLSKESFEKNALDQYAIKHGKKIKKLTVNEKLYSDLKKAREILTESFKTWNEDVDKETLDEGVQRILDRLVFIRVLEDRGLEDMTLKPILREWEVGGKKDQLFQLMIKKFRELNDIYNSNLFKEHACEKWEEYDDKIVTVINMLYGSAVYEYDFEKIPADILGGVYESYLGYIAQNPIEVDKTGKSGKLLKIEGKKEIKTKSRKKRKEQGIYYTPKFIVDYIVENTLGKKLEEVKSMHELKQIKVLDPACGSGSFLTKALEAINDKYKDFGNTGDQRTKSEILLSNIYGVDLDPQAVEIAKLNLLVSALDEKAKLPDLTGNVRVGNSLISGSEKELKKYFDKDWRDKRPFNWEEEFPFCRSLEKGNPGFDVVIGNPPYLSIERGFLEDVSYFKDYYKTIEKIYDIFGLFIEKSLSLLKDDGYLGFIMPNIILQNDSFRLLRKFILDHTKIISINDYKDGVFADAVVPTAVVILKKSNKQKNNRVEMNLYQKSELNKTVKIKQSAFLNESLFRFNLSMDDNFIKFKDKLYKDSVLLKDVLKTQEAIKTGDDKKFISDSSINSKNQKILLKGSDIDRYKIINERFIDYNIRKLKRPGKDEVFNLPKKLYIRRIANKLIAVLDAKQRYAVHTLYTGVIMNKNYSYEYILALLNSSLFTYLYQNLYPFKGNVFPEIRIGNLGQLPVKEVDKKSQKVFENLVNKILKLNKQLQSIPKNSDKWDLVKKEIEKIDKEIDERVFELYNLTKQEIKIVEKF